MCGSGKVDLIWLPGKKLEGLLESNGSIFLRTPIKDINIVVNEVMFHFMHSLLMYTPFYVS